MQQHHGANDTDRRARKEPGEPGKFMGSSWTSHPKPFARASECLRQDRSRRGVRPISVRITTDLGVGVGAG